MRSITILLLAVLPSCLQEPSRRVMPDDEPWRETHGADLEVGQVISQAMIGVSQFETAERSGGNDPSVGVSAGDLEQLPFLAGSISEALGGGEYLDYGWEGGASLGFVTSGGFVAAGGGGLIIAVDVDLLLVDLFFGPFVSLNVGERIRFYGGAGPLIDFAAYSHEGEEAGTTIDDSSTGLGLGWYVRGGAEILLGGRYMLGVGYRWVDSRIALSGDMGTLDLEGSQAFLSLSTGW